MGSDGPVAYPLLDGRFALAALSLYPDQDETELALRLRAASPYATPNARIIAIGDRLLGRKGRLEAAIKAIGRGADTDGNVPFVLPLRS